MIVRTMNLEDIKKVREVELAAWGEEAATDEQITQRSLTFPMGSVVVEDENGVIVGYAASQLVDHISTKSWAKQTDNGFITKTHRPDGQLAYGVSMSGVKNGVGAAVISYYHDIYIKSGLCSILCLGSRLPGFQAWHNRTKKDIKSYLSDQVGGLSRDPELRLYQKNGFQFLWAINGYFSDAKSLDYGALIVRK
ncbi:hypothetical protein CWB73_06895 [Pseudoalteromonas phenolica]|uniref:N-acetyltransferase domain-containing protein n=1 Tax=Pseudoalteromonas phenolica TaxID=161398 RepID=A0A5S3YWP3_9GAMM|nr:hypothetical protein [Pseudoalteromonas phenolica]TMP81610.1 hypothetical protein CWB73_06895 [Pseudoalteromonas phenolica]